MNPIVLLCPGQGAQALGMGRAWHDASPEARAVFEDAERSLGTRLGAPLRSLCFDGPPDTLNRTDVSQPAIFTVSVACLRGLCAAWGLAPDEIRLAATAGLSLGEYTALHAAGAIAFDDALELVALRGRAMQDAAEAAPSGMVALIGADDAQAHAVCEQARAADVLVCANFNAPGQVVLSGSTAACERAVKAAESMGLRAQPLPVAGAFHSPLMIPAAERLAEALIRTTIRPPRCPVLSNVTGLPHAAASDTIPGGTGVPPVPKALADSIRLRLVEQLTQPVRWADCARWLAANTAAAAMHELAPGRTLAGLMRRIDRGLKVEAHDVPSE
ncbi:MAG: ACP S-malonyltransferase [Phycisphaeraceae bacterium]|nr:ACP S-malonyltransferase [Phycisphaeraceae bacterium]